MIRRLRDRIEIFVEKNRKYVMPIAVIVGFIGDILTLRRIDRLFDNIVLTTHLIIVGAMVAFLFSKGSRIGRVFKVEKFEGIYTTLMLFSFGALFSGFTIFYTRSGSLLSAWPFILLLALLMFGTEFFKSYFKRIIAQFVLYYFVIFSYLIVLIPLFVKDLGTQWFVVSGVLSLIVIFFYAQFLAKLNRERYLMYRKNMKFYVLGVFAIINFLYFTNIIPPVPLSLKYIAVYHSVEEIEGKYLVSYEKPALISLRKRSHVFHWDGNSSVYVFSSVYSPIGFKTEIHHVWKYFDTDKNRWYTENDIPIKIVGGRIEGYRGYSYKTNLHPGSWRVVVENVRGQALGYINFKIKEGDPSPIIFEEI